jgi:4-diphosphocytidyl-2-C-methyl-D-erythritol kinase
MTNYKSYAKINLGLQVLKKRTDGFHDINTVFKTVCLHDNITIKPYKELKVSCIPPLGISQEKNLAYQSGKLLQKKFDCKSKGAEIIINKKIPDGGGLAGGSSNAAVTMIILNNLWQINAGIDMLADISRELGSDVPFFLKGDCAVGQGRGELLDYFKLDLPYHILFVFPGIKVSTSWAYENLNMKDVALKPKDFKSILQNNIDSPEIFRKEITNDFETVIFDKHILLKEIKEQIYSLGADFSLMSGSGSTIFGFFKSIDLMNNAVREFKDYKTHTCIKSLKC